MKQTLTVGIIQPVIDPATAWNSAPPFSLNIDIISAERVWDEIRIGLTEMLKVDLRPDIILIPELHLPASRIETIKRLSKKHGVIIIAGIDFQLHPIHAHKIRNRGIICLPNEINTGNPSMRMTSMQFGKTHFTYMERSMFKNMSGSVKVCEPDPESNMYIFKSNTLGDFGIMICSDIFDIERMSFYQGQIHHLFVISLNKDLNTYFSMAESLTRLLYCNVIICNTGHYGGSLAVSPYREPFDRTIYKYIGQRMFNTHIIDLPVKKLDEAQRFDFSKEDAKHIFKASPPGYKR